MLLEFRAHRTLGDALFELALKVLELKVAILEAIGQRAQVRRQAFGFFKASLLGPKEIICDYN